MIVRLTTGQEDATLRAVEGDRAMVEALTVDRRQPLTIEGRPVKRVDIYAPYAAWVFALDALLDRAFNHRGYRMRGVPSTVQAATKSISQAIGFIDRHPALRGTGVIGHHPIVFHVWRLGLDQVFDGRLYSPYPQRQQPSEFVVLAPTWQRGPGRTQITTWSVEGVRPATDRLSDEAVHQVLWRAGLAATRDEYLRRGVADEG